MGLSHCEYICTSSFYTVIPIGYITETTAFLSRFTTISFIHEQNALTHLHHYGMRMTSLGTRTSPVKKSCAINFTSNIDAND